MANETKPNTPPTFTWNAAAVQEKLTKVREYYKQFDGKPGMNPWFYVLNTLVPLESRVKAGEQSLELHNAIAQLKLEEPRV
jgi:hypothetical protein